MKPERIDILGVPVDCVNMEQAVAAVDAMIEGESPQSIIAVNPEKIMKGRQDPDLLRQLHSSGLLIPDGIGVVIAARIFGLAKMERVPGSELMPAICELAAHKGYRIFLFGADPEVNQKTHDILLRRYPGIRIVGNRDGYLDDSEMSSLVSEISSSGADILFIALGSPRQELWMRKYLNNSNVKVCQGVGGTFDVIAGKVRRAPAIFRNLHLEWFYRLLSNPRRMLRQTALPQFLIAVMKKRLLAR
jgi:N-acetylglucosaminyldiphosphoundecaprenol N-acetyl-beta-D-mannosaminyltransferase